MHDPGRQAEIAAARVRGGKGKSRATRLDRLVPASLRPLLGQVTEAIAEVHSGALTPAQGTAIAALAGAAVRLFTVATLEQRVADLEAGRQGGGK